MKPHRSFDAENDASVLRKAMKGLGVYTTIIICGVLVCEFYFCPSLIMKRLLRRPLSNCVSELTNYIA